MLQLLLLLQATQLLQLLVLLLMLLLDLVQVPGREVEPRVRRSSLLQLRLWLWLWRLLLLVAVVSLLLHESGVDGWDLTVHRLLL